MDSKIKTFAKLFIVIVVILMLTQIAGIIFALTNPDVIGDYFGKIFKAFNDVQ